MRAERRADLVWIGLILGYALLGAILRPFYGAGFSYDEAEAFYYARDLRLGYDAQPPLYFWLQWGLFQLIGETVFAVGLLKAATLALVGCALYGLLREAHPPALAGLGVAGLALLPDVLWRSQRALTHSVLTLGLTILATWLLWRALQNGRWRDWVALGLALGLGMLSKWNYLMVPATLLVAVVRDGRTRSLSRRGVGLAVVIAAALVAGPALWTLAHFDRATGTFGKLGFEAQGALPAPVAAVIAMIVTLAAVLGLLALVTGVMARQMRGRSRPPMPPLDRFLWRVLVAGIGLMLLAMLVSGSTRMQNHWLLPLAYLAAPLVLLRLAPVMSPRGMRRFKLGLGAVWLSVAALLFYEGRVDPGWRGLNYARLAGTLRDAAPEGTPVVTNEIRMAGILPLFLREREILYLQDLSGPTDLPGGPLLWITMPVRETDPTAEGLAQERGRMAEDTQAIELDRGFRTTRFDIALSR